MIRRIIWFCFVSLASLVAAGGAIGQETTATATPASVSSSVPSSFKIRANILAQKQAALEAQIEVAQRCVKNASLPTVLRDPEGNVRVVPQTDVVNCARRLRNLQRQLASLAREFDRLSKDAEGSSFRLQGLRQQALTRARLRGQPNQ